MSDRLPYETQLAHQWDALPLPDINTAWADMKRRLEEDDDDRKPIAWWSRGCMLWGLLLLAVLGTGWWIFRPDKWFDKKESITSSTSPQIQKPVPGTAIPADTIVISDTKQIEPSRVLPPGELSDIVREPVKTNISIVHPPARKEKRIVPRNNFKPAKYNIIKDRGAKKPNLRSSNKVTPLNPIQMENDQDQKDTTKLVQVKDPAIIGRDTVGVAINPIAKIDSTVIAVVKDTLQSKKDAEDSVYTKANDNKDKPKKPVFFSAGIALHQQLPVAGQKLTPYNSLGRKASLADYIPSVYVRLNKEDKWFLQGEFRYGAPQYTKDFTYDQQVFPDTGQTPVFTTIVSLNLKKTFYHQLPLTFNYFVAKNWAVGAGLQWNKFTGAIAEREINRRNNILQQDSILSKMILPKDDTAFQFTKSYFLGVVETEYKWKRFSAGARYTFGLQPYIRFSLPNGPAQQQKSTTLQIFLRYQLWRSKGR